MGYQNPTPVAVCLVKTPQGHVWGVQRVIVPFGIALPGGYVDKLESAEMAAAREFFEETGVRTQGDQWHPYCTRIAPNNRLLIFLALDMALDIKAAQTTFKPTPETVALVELNAHTNLVFPLHQQVLRAYLT